MLLKAGFVCLIVYFYAKNHKDTVKKIKMCLKSIWAKEQLTFITAFQSKIGF